MMIKRLNYNFIRRHNLHNRHNLLRLKVLPYLRLMKLVIKYKLLINLQQTCLAALPTYIYRELIPFWVDCTQHLFNVKAVFCVMFKPFYQIKFCSRMQQNNKCEGQWPLAMWDCQLVVPWNWAKRSLPSQIPGRTTPSRVWWPDSVRFQDHFRYASADNIHMTELL